MVGDFTEREAAIINSFIRQSPVRLRSLTRRRTLEKVWLWRSESRLA